MPRENKYSITDEVPLRGFSFGQVSYLITLCILQQGKIENDVRYHLNDPDGAGKLSADSLAPQLMKVKNLRAQLERALK